MQHLTFGRIVERLRQLTRNTERIGERRPAVFTHDDVERIGGGKILREKSVAPGVNSRGASGGNDWMLQFRGDQLLEFGNELVNALGWKIEPENFYGNESIAIGVIRAKDGAQSTIADLVEHAKWTEGVRRRGAGSFRVQSRLL